MFLDTLAEERLADPIENNYFYAVISSRKEDYSNTDRKLLYLRNYTHTHIHR